jgi:hypothetical protein
MAYYPIFINLEGKNCLIIGGGKVAERKAATLLDYKANIRIVSPQVEDTIDKWSQEHRLSWRQGEFQESDLKDIFMAFVATDDQKITESVVQLCRSRGILVNAVDDPPSCDFFCTVDFAATIVGNCYLYRGKKSYVRQKTKEGVRKDNYSCLWRVSGIAGRAAGFCKKEHTQYI